MEIYDFFGISKEASKEEIKKIYKSLSKKLHPDKNGNNEDFIKLKKFYDILIDDYKRKRYDLTSIIEDEVNYETEAGNYIIRLYSQLINQLGSGITKKDIVSSIKALLIQTLAGIENAKTNIEAEKRIHLSLIERISYSGEKDVLTSYSKQALSNLEFNELEEERKRNIINKALIIIGNYSYKIDVEPKRTITTISQDLKDVENL